MRATLTRATARRRSARAAPPSRAAYKHEKHGAGSNLGGVRRYESYERHQEVGGGRRYESYQSTTQEYTGGGGYGYGYGTCSPLSYGA